VFDATTRHLRALRGWRADLAAAVTGAVSAAALPPVHLIPILLITIPTLLVIIDAAPGAAVAARRGYWFGFGLNMAGLYWITEAILVEVNQFWWLVPFAVPLVALGMALFVAAPVAVAKAAPAGWRRVLLLAAAWTLADLARQFVLTGFPWNLWGSVWEMPGRLGDVFIQPAALTGIHGLSLATLILAGAPLLGWRGRAGCAALLAAWAGYGVVRLDRPQPRAPGLSVVLVQGNVPQPDKWSRELALEIFRRYLALTARGVREAGAGPAVVVWPESASPFLLAQDAAAREAILNASGGVPVLAGSDRLNGDNRPRNSLMAITTPGPPAAIYDKWHLVPFGEYQPDWFPLPIQLIPGGGFAPGPGPRTYHLPGLPPFGPLICYEAIFGGQIVDRADRPAWLVNVTNDAWFGNTSGPRQHLAAARMRAVEEGLPLMRAANTGITAGFDAFGRELGRLGLGRTGVLVLKLPGALPPTLFARFGLPIPALLAFGLLLVALPWRRNPSVRGNINET
jgi:apolipoprotein N-acyltransferase